MQESQSSVFARDDTFFGVCEALGEDLGFNPIYLRITFAVFLLWKPVEVIAAYAIAGLVVGLTRWFFPNPRTAAEPEWTAEAQPAAEPQPQNDEAEALAVAA